MRDLASEYLTSSDIILTKEEILLDYRLACESRSVSLLGRKDVFMGRAKFGIFGDGKELAQICMSKVFRKGDFRSGYYRDQTFVVAVNGMNWQQFFAQLYAHADINHDPFSAGRSMNGHYSNHWVDNDGNWKNQTEMFNNIMDVSSTAGQMPRSIGIAYASKLYRNNKHLKEFKKFSINGNEVCFSTIGDASTSQGMFFESINAAGVLQIPIIFSVWDDGYGISVPKELQTTKSSISDALIGFQRENGSNGIEIIKARGWNYPELIAAYQKAARFARDEHVPVLVHVTEMTQPQGHSASGSHERYKDKSRLDWENENDCNLKFREWILKEGYSTEKELLLIETEAEELAKEARVNAWKAIKKSIIDETSETVKLIKSLIDKSRFKKEILVLIKEFEKIPNPLRKDALILLKKTNRFLIQEQTDAEIKQKIKAQIDKIQVLNSNRYTSHLYSEFASSPLKVQEVVPKYNNSPELLDGREIINSYFDQLFTQNPLVFAIGEDIGKIGDVNQGFAGLQEKHGEIRITDTGIRETTIIGQGIGAAMRGLRPIVEVQYFDYIYYCLATLTDDLASLRYRTMGRQLAPLIIRTRGHRLEGIWHSGSPMAVMLGSLRGIHIAVPRNFVQAAGIYNTLLKGDDPALVVECLNGYRLKEELPSNLNEICVPLGQIEILKEGSDISIVTYGSMCRIVLEAAKQLSQIGIEVEVIDVQTLVPFDRAQNILSSIKKTNRVIFADEDMPGGASAYMMQQVLDVQNAYKYLDSKPLAIAASDNRPSYGSDGDYFTKPNIENIYEACYEIMHEAKPSLFPSLY